MQTGVYNGWIMFPSGWVNFKLYEVGKYYTEIGFGAITWHGLTINQARWAKLPKDVQDIILEVGQGVRGADRHGEQGELSEADRAAEGYGAIVKQLPDAVRVDWANSLKGWPQEKATELDKAGLPGKPGAQARAGGSGKARPQVAGALPGQVDRTLAIRARLARP